MEAFLQVEALDQQLAEQQQALLQLEETWQSGQTALLQEETRLKRAYAQGKQQRETLTQSIDAPSLELYEQLRSRKAGVAVSPIQNGQCGVCHVQVPTGVISAVRGRTDEISYCPSCGRILFAG